MKGKKRCLFLIILLSITSLPLVNGQTSGAPTWANEGVHVSYGWELWEYCPVEELDEKIDLLKYNSDITYVMELTTFDNEIGVFNISVPNSQSTAIWEYSWEEASWDTTTGFSIYYPDSKLQDAPLVELDTVLGHYNAYKIETQVTVGQTVRNETYWFEESTNVLLLRVSTAGDTEVDLIVMPLLGTDLWASTREYQVVFGEDLYDVVSTSNSTINWVSLQPDNNLLTFNVTGASGTKGFCEISIPNELLWGEFTLYKDGAQLVKDVDYTETNNSTHHTFNISYLHSTHIITIESTQSIPEFTTFILLSTFIILTIAAIISKKRLNKSEG